MIRKEKAVAIYSGGLDSTVLLYSLLANNFDVLPLSIDYGQRHRKELESAKLFCERLSLPHQVADLSAIKHLLAGSSQTSDEIDVPEGHYTDATMKQTVVPNRNMIMLSVAAGYAISQKADVVVYGAHAGDHAIYPDCRPEFAAAVDLSIMLADWHRVRLLRPFITVTKADIVHAGNALGVPMHLTWSCYKGGDRHCGKCGTCVERKEAFQIAGVEDLTDYEPQLVLAESLPTAEQAKRLAST